MIQPDPLDDLADLLADLDDDELAAVLEGLPVPVFEALSGVVTTDRSMDAPPTPLAQAQELDAKFRARPHLEYLSDRLAQAVADVEAGQNRFLTVSMPPRAGKSTLTAVNFPLWCLRKHPDWKFGAISHSPELATYFGRQIRRTVEQQGQALGLAIAPDAGAVHQWQTTEGGGVVSRSAPGQSVTGLGFKVLIIDDIVKDYAAAHSALARQAVWDWWLANAMTRLEPPYLVIVVGTRWHQDDFIGRLRSHEYEGDPADWEVISFPAIAMDNDVLGRKPGQPLYSPLLEETEEEALARWANIRTTLGTYTFNSQFQQDPIAAKGEVFDSDWWRFWTTNPALAEASPDTVRLWEPSEHLSDGEWLDSWDCAFKATDTSDFVVGQRWCKVGPDRFLVRQHRERMTFTSTLEKMREWVSPDSPHGTAVHLRLVEDKANGTAIIDVMRREIAGLVAVNPTESKEARARSVTPEIESGNVWLPHPMDPGNEWVSELLAEFREFPHGAHDDSVDSLTQALTRLRAVRRSEGMSVPGRGGRMVPSRPSLLQPRGAGPAMGNVRRLG